MIWEELTKIFVDDILKGLNVVIILYIILHFIKQYILPKIPEWIHQYRMVTLEKQAIEKAIAGRNK